MNRLLIIVILTLAVSLVASFVFNQESIKDITVVERLLHQEEKNTFIEHKNSNHEDSTGISQNTIRSNFFDVEKYDNLEYLGHDLLLRAQNNDDLAQLHLSQLIYYCSLLPNEPDNLSGDPYIYLSLYNSHRRKCSGLQNVYAVDFESTYHWLRTSAGNGNLVARFIMQFDQFELLNQDELIKVFNSHESLPYTWLAEESNNKTDRVAWLLVACSKGLDCSHEGLYWKLMMKLGSVCSLNTHLSKACYLDISINQFISYRYSQESKTRIYERYREFSQLIHTIKLNTDLIEYLSKLNKD